MATAHVPAFGVLLKRYRRAAGLTQEALAARAGYSAVYVRMLESGARTPLAATVVLLADALALTGDDRATFLAARPRTGANRPTPGAPALSQGPAVPTGGAPPVRIFLIAEIRGYSRFTTEHGDEAAAALAARFAALVREVVQASDGQLLELRGDEAMVIFASARQALQSAVALQSRFAEATDANPTLPLPVGVGLDAGEAIPVVDGYRGAALNLAARLCSLAGPGEVLASESVAHLARKMAGLDYHDRGTVYLKGFAEPERVLQVQSATTPVGAHTPAVAEVEISSAGEGTDVAAMPLPLGGFLGALPTGPLVARRQELDRIQTTTSAVVAGSGRLLLLAGEPGVGKTRLAQEVTLALRDRRFSLGFGRCYVPEQAVAYYPFRDTLAMLYTMASADMRSQVPIRWPRLARLLPIQVALPLRTALPETDPASSQEAQHRLFAEVTRFILALADQRPVAVLLDDIHWADSASLALLKHVARHTRAARVLLLGIYRESEVPLQHPLHVALAELERERLVERLAVQRLSQEGTTALVAASLGSGEVAPGLATLLYEHTNGNPFFTQEVLRGLVERGDVYRESDQWTLRSGADMEVPESVRSAIAERVWRVSEQAQQVLHEASVLGQTFTFDDLAGMSGRPEDALDAALEEARAAGLVRESARDGYAFPHVLIQQALYADLSLRSRRRLHQSVGEALERLSEPARERRVAELAFHFARSIDHEKALLYLMRAAERTRTAAAYHEEATLLGQALELAEQLERRQLVSELHVLRGRAFRALDQHAESESEYVAVLDGLAPEQIEQRSAILAELAEVCVFFAFEGVFRIPDARRYASEALALAERIRREDLAARAISALAIADTSDGHVHAAQEQFRRAFAHAGPGPRRPLTFGIDQYGLNLYYLGEYGEAAERLQEVLDYARSSHDLTYWPRVLGNLLITLAAQGRYQEAFQRFEEVRQFARAYGSGRWVARAIAMWGGVHLDVCDYAGAEELAEEARELARSVGFPPAVASPGIDLLFNYVRCHDVGRTESLVDTVAETVARAQGIHGWLWRLRLAQARAEIALARGEHEEALRRADDALAQSRLRGRVKYQIAGLVTRGQALAGIGLERQGIADLRHAYELARGLGDPAVLLRAAAPLLEREGDDVVLAAARAATEAIAAALPDEELHRRFKAAEPVRLVARLTT